MLEARLQRRAIAPGAALAMLARDLLADFSNTAPDLTGAVIVLPNLHAASAMARALGSEAGRPLLLPKTTTLGKWAAEQPLSCKRLPEVARVAGLFGALRSRKWFETPDLWPLAGELSRLFDELTQFEVALPATVREFERALEAAYQTRAGEAMQLEARLVYELWHASTQPRDGALDSSAAYQLQLAAIASEASRPLYVIGLPILTLAEQRFLEAYAARAPVKVYQVAGSVRGASGSARFFASVWPSADDRAVLRERALEFARSLPSSPVAENLRLYGAASLEQEARAVDTQVRLWLKEGRKKIAVVALDRLVARRARALLERARVMPEDETGWIFSTTSASTVVMRWLDAVSSGFYYRDLLDLVKSPFIFAGWKDRREAVYELEGAIRANSVVAGIDAFRSALRLDASRDSALAAELLDRLEEAAHVLRRDGLRSLHQWLAMLFDCLAALGIEEGLRRDPAGLQLFDYLQRLARELVDSEDQFSFGEWRHWLDRQLELADFRDTGVASPVIFTQLSLTRLREFDAVALTGCDSSHLPGSDPGSLFFNQSVRAQLGLPTSEQRLTQITDDLTGLLSRSGSVLVTWQKLRDGEENLLSPLFERIDVFHQMAWDSRLEDNLLDRLLPLAQVAAPGEAPLPELSSRPAPAVPEERVPPRISAGAYNSLVACPYQFYGRYILGLREPEEVREEMEKRDYGEYVHRVLHRFHTRFPVCTEVGRDQLESALCDISDQVFREAIEASYLSHAWALRWRAAIAGYLDWQIDRERQGWRFHAAESKRGIEIGLPDGAVLRLEGRLDRIDRRTQQGNERFAVIDYKTRSPGDLRRAVDEPGEDVQLPVYVALLADQTEEALYLSIDAKQTRPVFLDAQALAETGAATERLQSIFGRMRAGASLTAQGVEAVCQWCELQGLCRKKYWS